MFNREFYNFSEFIEGFLQSRGFGENNADAEHEWQEESCQYVTNRREFDIEIGLEYFSFQRRGRNFTNT